MGRLVWKEEYGVGDHRLDYEHKQLMSLADKVIQFAVVGEAAEKVKAALKMLNSYTRIQGRHRFSEH